MEQKVNRRDRDMATEKFKALAHFIMHECRDDPARLGAIRLNKAMWKADVAAFKATGQPVTGDRYVKRGMGPVPKHILATIRELRDEGAIAVQEPEFQYDTRRFVALRAPEDHALTDDEKQLARAALASVCGMTANAASEETHDVVWDAAVEGEEIPIKATLAARAGEITPQVLAWAESSMASRQPA